MRLVILVPNGGQLRDEYSARLMACLSDRHVRSFLKTVGFPATVHFVLIAKERLPWRFWVRRASAVEGFPVGSRGPLRCRSAHWPVRTGHPRPLTLPVRVAESSPLGSPGGRPYSLIAGTCDRPESSTTSAISPSDSPSRRTAGARRAATKAGATAGLSRPCRRSTGRALS